MKLVCFLALSSAAYGSAAGASEANALDRLAAVVGCDPSRLELSSVGEETLVDGRRVVTVKAVDGLTGEILGASFIGDEPVDRAAEKAAAGAGWRVLHGALTPAMVERLETSGDGDLVVVAVWYAAEIEGLPKPDSPPPRRAPGESAAGPGVQSVAGAPTDKLPSDPLGPGEVPDDIRVRLERVEALPAVATNGSKPIESLEEQRGLDGAELEWRQLELEAGRVFDAQNLGRLRDSVAGQRTRVLERLDLAGVDVLYASDVVPMAVLAASKTTIESLAFWPELDAIDPADGSRGPALATARPTQNADLVNFAGYDGTGVTVSVTEGERIFPANPYLTVTDVFDPIPSAKPHPTAVGGIIASTHGTYHGLASGVDLLSANGGYGTFGNMAAAMDWGSANAQVLNNSWYWETGDNNPLFWEADRHQDYFVRYAYDFVTVAAGNFGNGCTSSGGFWSNYVTSPAKGYNVMSVGNFDDLDTLGWSIDAMDLCSSYGDPGGDGAATHSKPEISAVGSGITSTTATSVPGSAIGPVGSGTSYASPMVAATAATLIQAEPQLGNKPEVLKAALMATALHNIEGDTRLSDVDGTGGMVSSAAAAVVERGDWDDRYLGSTTTFPLQYEAYAYAGETVRFAIVWLSDPNAGYTADQLPADLDLRAYRADGTTLITNSVSSQNGFEIVEFVAPATETYKFKVSLFGAWTGGNTWFGAAWWRGVWRIGEEIGYSDPEATPLGTHLAVVPADGSPTNYWRAFGIRPDATSDHDLTLRTASYFDDPGPRRTLTGSGYLAGEVDFVVVDGNHWPAASPEHYRVNRYGGSGGYKVSRSNLGELFSSGPGGVHGPYTMAPGEVVKVFDVAFQPDEERILTVAPSTGTPNGDLHVSLFRSDPGLSTTWAQPRSGAVVTADAQGVGLDAETLTYRNTTGSFDYLGLVVANKVDEPVTFYIEVEDTNLFADGFESGTTGAWSTTVP